jgi:hypothetical protein
MQPVFDLGPPFLLVIEALQHRAMRQGPVRSPGASSP